MPHHTRKRARVPAQYSTDNNSVITDASGSSDETTTADQLYNDIIDNIRVARRTLFDNIGKLIQVPDLPTRPIHQAIIDLYTVIPNQLYFLLQKLPNLRDHEKSTSCHNEVKDLVMALSRYIDRPTQTTSEPELMPQPPKPSYANVASQANDATPIHPAQPLTHDPRPSLVPRPDTAPHSHKPHGQPRPKGATPTPSPRSSTSAPKAKTHVRLIARVANDAKAFTSPNPRWKTVPTNCFSTLAQEFKSFAPSCTPLGYYTNKKGNLVITFSGTTPRDVLMSQTRLIRGSFELSHHIPIIFDTPWSTLHLANVPARSSATTTVFDQAALTSSILDNPAISGLTITSQPRWLRHPSKIIGTRSSAVFSFEDPDGAIARQLLKTPLFVFGSPVTVKPWINKPTKVASPPTESALASSSFMDVV